jgi:hypothetical protein
VKTCRLCAAPRVTPYFRLRDGRKNPRFLAASTGAFCSAHEMLFRAMRNTAYSDMGIVQAVEAFCLEHSTPLPRSAE